MSSHVSLKNLSKAITSHLQAVTPESLLPDELSQLIEDYLSRFPERDQAAADRLQEELLSIYERTVRNRPARYAAFLKLLNRFHGMLGSTKHVMQWFDIFVDGVLDNVSVEKGLAQQTKENLESVLLNDQGWNENDGGKSHPLFARFLAKWMTVTRVSTSDNDPAGAAKEKHMRDALVTCGRKKAKGFLLALNEFLVVSEYRSRVLTLLTEVIQTQPHHLHTVLETPLFEGLLQCLETDTSTSVVSLALTSLVMLLPSIPGSLEPFLPRLFNIYARLLFWEREKVTGLAVDGGPERRRSSGNTTWQKCEASEFDTDSSIIHLLAYFTILYGLYPLNFMDYIRKPQRYLRHANFPDADNIEVQPSEIRHLSERYRKQHFLHPNFYSMTVESERLELSRWNRIETTDVVAECVALCRPEPGSGFRPGSADLRESLTMPSSECLEKDGIADSGLLSPGTVLSPLDTHQHRSALFNSPSSSRAQSALLRHGSQSSHPSTRDSTRDSTGTRPPDAGADSPTLPPQLLLSPSHDDLQDMINSNKAIKAGLQSFPNDSVPSLALSHQESIPEKPHARNSGPQPSISAPVPAPEPSQQVAELQREILLLKNDLNFERYMKQQHVTHIGVLRRQHMKEAVTEGEMQALIMSNRNLKIRFEDAKRSEIQIKKESERSRAMAQKWECDLMTRLRNLREEQKAWTVEGNILKRDLQESREECKKLRILVRDSEGKESNAKRLLQSVELQVAELERHEGQAKRIVALEREANEKEEARRAAVTKADEEQRRAKALEMRLRGRDVDSEKKMNRLKEHIDSLEAQLEDARNRGLRVFPDTMSGPVIESSFAAARARQQELQNSYDKLLKKYNALQLSMLDQKYGMGSTSLRKDAAASPDADAQVSAIMGAPTSVVRSRTQGGMSEGGSDGTSFDNATSPVDIHGSSSAGLPRPSTPPGHRGTPEGGGHSHTSPNNDRYFGRGGVQNTIRKERKDKKKDDPDKKEKKSTGLRGIRGFVG